MTLTRAQARSWGLAAVAAVAALELLSGLICGERDVASQAIALGFLLIPLAPALVALMTPNPLCAVAAALPVAGWIIYAFVDECVRPQTGGGASMIYLGVWFYGLFSAVAAALAAIPLLRWIGVHVGDA